MLFDIPSIANWKKIGDYRQRQTNNLRKRIQDKVGVKILVRKQVLSAKKSLCDHTIHDDCLNLMNEQPGLNAETSLKGLKYDK